MPNSRYRTLRWHERVKDFPFTHAVAIGMLLNVIVLIAVLGISPFGFGMAMWLAFFAVLGAGNILVGIQWRGTVIMGYGVEQTGHWLALGAWLVDLWILYQFGAFASMVTPLVFMVAHVVRAIHLYRETKQIKHIMREKARHAGDAS